MPYSDGLNIMTTGLSWPSLQPGGLNTYFKSVCEQLSSTQPGACADLQSGDAIHLEGTDYS